jgi:hypothetical protein
MSKLKFYCRAMSGACFVCLWKRFCYRSCNFDEFVFSSTFSETNGIELPISKTPVKLTMATLTDSVKRSQMICCFSTH